jgi:hypothetical protein
MPKLSAIQNDNTTLKVVIPFEGGDLNLVVYPNRITGKRTKEMQALADMTDEDMPEGVTVEDRAAELLFDVIKSWDLEDDDGAVLPFNAATQALLSVATMTTIYTEIGEQTNPNSAKSKKSRGR